MRVVDIAIPGEGEKIKINLTGKSFQVESCPVYSKASEVPVFEFENGSGQRAMYPQSTYNNGGREINSIILKGTAESGSGTLTISTYDDCLENDIRIQFADAYASEPGTSFEVVASDSTVKSLDLADITNAEGLVAKAVYVTVANSAGTGGIKYAFNVDPVVGDDSLGGVIPQGSEPFRLKNDAWALAFRFVSEDAAQTPSVTFTPEF